MRTQRGFVTLGISLMLVSLVSLNAFLGTKGSLLEQQSSNNVYYAEQAFQHAEMGLTQAKTNINQYLAANPNVTTVSAIPSNLTTLNSPNVYSTTISGNKLISTGYVNGVGIRRVAQYIQITAGTGSGPAALTALGSINLGGSTSATSVKSGGTITGNVPAQSYSNTNEFKVALLDHNGNILKDASGNIVYRSMTSYEYFMYYFSGLCPNAKAAYDNGDLTQAVNCEIEAKASIAASSKGYICDAVDCSTKAEDDKITTAYNNGKRIFWLENGGIDHQVSMGTAADPVLIFVMNIPDASKSAKINAGSTIYGVLYVDVLDTQTIIGCSCSADAVITNLLVQSSYVDDLTKPIYTLTSTGGTNCSSNAGCKDSQGTTIPKGSRYLITYQQKVSSSLTTPVYGNFTNLALNIPSPTICTINACTAAMSTASMTCTGGSLVGNAGKCSFLADAVSGTNNTAVQIEVTGTWEAGGTGNSSVQGAVITSGNYSGTGNAAYIQNSMAITNIVLGGVGGTGFSVKPSTMTMSGWSDMN